MGDFLDDPQQEENFERQLEELDEEERQRQLVERQREKNRLKKILKTAPWRFYPHLTMQEQNFLRRMKKKGHANEVRAIQSAVDLRREAFKMKANTALTTGAPAIGIFALVIFIIIAIIVIVATLFPWLFPEDENGNKGAASPFGMKGDKFYGARAVYKDENLSRNGLVEQYVDIIKSAADPFKDGKIYTDIDISGEIYDVKVTIDLTTILPAENFNYEELDLATFETDYPVLNGIVSDIAMISYYVDNDIDSTGTLSETLDGVKYFGFNAEMLGTTILDENPDVDNNVIEIVYDTLKSYTTILGKGEGETEYSTSLTLDNVKDSANFTFKSDIESLLNKEENKIRTEKLFIKDFILEDAESYIENVKKKNYVALIYMSKEDVDFSYISHTITIDKNADFSVVLTNNGSEITLTKGEGENLGNEEETSELSYMFKSSDNLKQTCNTTTIIDASNLNQFTNESSLFKVVSQANDYTIYLQETIDENDEKVLTYKTGNMYATFECSAEFYFNEELKYGE